MARIVRRTPRIPGEPKASDHWRTPRDLFLALHAEFGFQVDLAADATNRLLARWLGPGGLAPDALRADWTDYGRRGWLNPPYSTELIARFCGKALTEAGRGFTTVALLPYTPSTRWWACTHDAAEIRELPARVKYLKADGATPASAMFPSAVVIWRPQPGVLRGEPRRVLWTHRKDDTA